MGNAQTRNAHTGPGDFPKLVTGAQMTAIDRDSIDNHGVAGAELMERAGGRVVESLRERWGGLEGLRVAVVCGKGNNGGDGFVVARRLREAAVPVDVYLEALAGEISGDAGIHLQRLRAAGVEARTLPAADEAARAVLGEADVIVDALLGTGLRGAPRPPTGVIIRRINAAGRPVIAVDLPSGVEADSGRVEGDCVRAVVTVTFGLPKVGHLFQPGRSRCGALELVDIGFPDAAVDACPATTYLLTAPGIARRIPRRSADAHKGTCGAVFVLAGSAGMTGAAALAADAALRGGAGRVVLGAPASLNDILEVKLTEVMTRALPEVRRPRCLSLRGLGEAADLARQADAFAIGPGLGRHRETAELVRRLLARADLPPTVVDADALNAAAREPAILGAGSGRVITPHPGEFERLSGIGPEDLRQDPCSPVVEFAKHHGVVVVLKGGPTVIAAPDGRAFVNPTGNAGMATAGSGDVLTGLVAALLGQGCAPLDAALTGVYLHGLSGDLARDELGEWGMRAGDLLQHLPKAFVEVVSEA